MTDTPPLIVWLRRDLRLSDNPMLSAAAASGRPVVPVFIHDGVMARTGAAARWRWGLSVAAMSDQLRRIGSRLICRRGPAAEVLSTLARETGATDIWFARTCDPDARERDETVGGALPEDLTLRAFSGHLLFEPQEVRTGTGGYYKVFTPFWKSVAPRDPGSPLPSVTALRAPSRWPETEDPAAWQLDRPMNRGAAIVAPHLAIGEPAARRRLDAFLDQGIDAYDAARDRLAVAGTSKLSENLTYGEISARTCWHAARSAEETGRGGALTWRKELVWRDFAHHLAWHTPRLTRVQLAPRMGRLPLAGRQPRGRGVAARPHRNARGRCRHARDVRDRNHAQPRAHDRRELPDQAPDDPLENRL